MNNITETTKMTIEDFNKKLIEDETHLTIIEYIKELNEIFFNIDISFIDDFVDLVNKDECCIHHDMLIKYGVLTNVSTSGVIKRIIEQNSDIQDLEALYNVVQCKTDVLSNKIVYFLHPRLFKIILMRSKITSKYARYYLLLEECIKHYNDYQLLQLKSKIQNICNDRILKLNNQDKKECFVLFKTDEDNLYGVIRGQIKNLKKSMKRLDKTNDDIILNIPCCCANNFYNKIKEELYEYIIYQKKYLFMNKGNVVEWSYDPTTMVNRHNEVTITRYISLIDITLNEFIEEINEINDERYRI